MDSASITNLNLLFQKTLDMKCKILAQQVDNNCAERVELIKIDSILKQIGQLVKSISNINLTLKNMSIPELHTINQQLLYQAYSTFVVT